MRVLLLLLLIVIGGGNAHWTLRLRHRRLLTVDTSLMNQQASALCDLGASISSLSNNQTTPKGTWASSISDSSCPTYGGSGPPAWCAWVGVNCSTGYLVSALTITNQAAAGPRFGTLPTSLGNLAAALSSLSITQTSALYGPVPTSLTLLTALKSLTFANLPSLNGSLPQGLRGLTGLKSISLGTLPALRGTISTSLTLLSSLQTILLDNVGATFSVPGSMSALSKLQFVSWVNLPVRSYGTLPGDWSTSLTRLEIRNAPLYGSIPASLSALTALKQLTLRDMQALSGTIPRCGGGRCAHARPAP